MTLSDHSISTIAGEGFAYEDTFCMGIVYRNRKFDQVTFDHK